MDSSTLDTVIEESAWTRQWFRSQHATLSLKKDVLVSCLANGRGPIARLLLLMTLCWFMRPWSVQVTRRSKRVRLLVKQARQHWMERQVAEIAVAAENGNLKPLYQFCKKRQNGSPKLLCRSSYQLELLRLPRKRWPLCGGINLPRISTTVSERFPLRIWQTTCKKSGLKFRIVTPAKAHW